MSKTEERVVAKVEQAIAPPPALKDAKPKPNRPRGRGRGKGNQKAETNKPPKQQNPSFSDRLAQVKQLEGAPQAPPAIQPLPMAQVSAAMDELYSTNMTPATAVENIAVDMKGLADVAATFYRALIAEDDKLERTLSQSEFMLCCGQFVVDHALRVRSSVTNQTIAGQAELMKAIPDDIEMPVPILDYAEGLGAVRNPQGQIVLPDVALPTVNAAVLGFTATRSSDKNQVADQNLLSSMYPFGMLARITEVSHLGQVPALNAVTANGISPEDAQLANWATLPRFRNMIPMHRDRVGKLQEPFSRAPLLASIKWNPELWNQFMQFLHKIERITKLRKPNRNAPGTAALFVVATPLDGDGGYYPNRYKFFSPVKLTNAEMHAGRLFRYRVKIVRAENAALGTLATANAYYESSPATTKFLTTTLSPIESMTAYLGMYVKQYVHARK